MAFYIVAGGSYVRDNLTVMWLGEGGYRKLFTQVLFCTTNTM